MRKVFVVAMREYNAAVRTKAFVIGLLMMPLLMLGSALLQWLLKDTRDTRDKVVAVIDGTRGEVVYDGVVKAIETYNNTTIYDPETQKQVRSKIVLEKRPYRDTAERTEELRKGKLAGWVVIGADILPPLADPDARDLPDSVKVVYETMRLPDQTFLDKVRLGVMQTVRAIRAREVGLSIEKMDLVTKRVIVEAKQETFQVSIFVPLILTMLMFMLVLMTATPLMQGVVEEKMQRIAEVLLGSMSPFQLMFGKLLGMAAVSLTISAVYLGGAYWAAHRYGAADHAPVSLLVWFIIFQALAALMFGSLFIAVGAACTDMRETQNLMWPIMLLATMPMFLLTQLLREPNSSVVVGTSFFPFATPSLMIARQAIPPGIPWWHPVVGALGMVATTVVCVYVAGRIFRVGILMMGKGASLGELTRWVFRG